MKSLARRYPFYSSRGFGLLAVVVLMGVPPRAGAQVYKYRDAQGHFVYSDQPPPSGTTARIVLKPQQPESRVAAEGRLRDERTRWQQAQSERAQQAEAAAAQVKGEDEARQRQCTAARRQMAEFGVDGRKYRFDAQSRRVYYSAAEIDQQRAEARALMNQYCSTPERRR